MRNCFLTCRCIGSAIGRNRKVLQVVKMDGGVVEFTAPVLVKELHIKFDGFGVKSSRKSCEFLPPSVELKMGETCYLVPITAPNHADSCVSAAKIEPDKSTAVKRIKVVITKKQLEDLLSNKTSVEKIIFGSDEASSTNSVSWKPSLASIPEDNEFTVM